MSPHAKSGDIEVLTLRERGREREREGEAAGLLAPSSAVIVAYRWPSGCPWKIRLPLKSQLLLATPGRPQRRQDLSLFFALVSA